MEPAAAAPSNLNIANALTVLRIVGVPLFGWLLLTEGGEDVGFRIWAFVAFVLLMITDRIDGDIARKPQPRHQLRQAGRPDRRQGAHRHGLRRSGDHLATVLWSGGSRSCCWCASGASR